MRNREDKRFSHKTKNERNKNTKSFSGQKLFFSHDKTHFHLVFVHLYMYIFFFCSFILVILSFSYLDVSLSSLVKSDGDACVCVCEQSATFRYWVLLSYVLGDICLLLRVRDRVENKMMRRRVKGRTLIFTDKVLNHLGVRDTRQ